MYIYHVYVILHIMLYDMSFTFHLHTCIHIHIQVHNIYYTQKDIEHTRVYVSQDFLSLYIISIDGNKIHQP